MAAGNRRIDRIVECIGKNAVKRAISEAYEEYCQKNNSKAWRIFLDGTDDWRVFRAMCDAAQAVLARERISFTTVS